MGRGSRNNSPILDNRFEFIEIEGQESDDWNRIIDLQDEIGKLTGFARPATN